MGEQFLLTNPAKRQYLNIDLFGENSKTGGVITGNEARSLHAIAVAWLVLYVDCEARKIRFDGELQGTWFGDRIYLAGDVSQPDPEGIQTSTDEDPNRTLFALSCREFQDITAQVIAEICLHNEDITTFLVKQAYCAGNYSDNFLLRTLLDAEKTTFGVAIEDELEAVFGPDWRTKCARTGDKGGGR